MTEISTSSSHEPFSLVLGGGGARGFAHLGVLRALEVLGYRPSSIVGVSMGALVASAYSLRDDWYDAVLSVDTSGFPKPGRRGRNVDSDSWSAKDAVGRGRVLWNMVRGWGTSERAVASVRRLLTELLGDKQLHEGRIPVVVCATDLISGARIELSSGLAQEAVYASAALAGVFPPLRQGAHLLVDGAYSDVAPVDVARKMDSRIVIAVNPAQSLDANTINNGAQAIIRAMEICHQRHSALSFQAADLTIAPIFPRYVDTLDFEARHTCVLAGAKSTRGLASELRQLLRPSLSPSTEGSQRP